MLRPVSWKPLSRAAVLGLLLTMIAARAAVSQAVVGFVENFNDPPSTAGWTGGADISNPGTGGVDGAGDGFLRVATAAIANLGSNSSLSPAYTGDYTAAGINRIKLWLNDVETDDALELHLLVGNSSNFWQRNAAFLPPHQTWAEYTVDLDGPTGWTQVYNIPGGHTWAEAMQTVDRLHMRHDRAPYSNIPDPIQGQYGLDKVLLTSSNVGVVPPASVVRPIELRVPYPNPSRGPVTFAMVQHRSTEVRIEIVDVTGRRVFANTLPAAGAGPRTFLWDGRGTNGQRVAPGAYRVRVTGPDGGMSQPLLRIE
jgi:hypothetical protein